MFTWVLLALLATGDVKNVYAYDEASCRQVERWFQAQGATNTACLPVQSPVALDQFGHPQKPTRKPVG